MRGRPQDRSVAVVACMLGLATIGRVGAETDDEARDAEARAAFDQLYTVLQSPRCRNCHPAGDAPLQGDAGAPHAQNITRRSVSNGLPCSSCHRERNAPSRHGPPGAPGWNLPPAETPMVFEGRTPRELCEQLKDPAQTHGKDLDALVEHIASDPLVRWGWSPGQGRSPPPLTHEETVDAARAWVNLGAACPEDE